MGAPQGLGRTGYRPYPGGLLLWDPAQAAVELQVLPPCQQVCDGVKLGTVTHVLVDRLEVGEHTAGWGEVSTGWGQVTMGQGEVNMPRMGGR